MHSPRSRASSYGGLAALCDAASVGVAVLGLVVAGAGLCENVLGLMVGGSIFTLSGAAALAVIGGRA